MRRAKEHFDSNHEGAGEHPAAVECWPLPEGYELFDFACASALLRSLQGQQKRDGSDVR